MAAWVFFGLTLGFRGLLLWASLGFLVGCGFFGLLGLAFLCVLGLLFGVLSLGSSLGSLGLFFLGFGIILYCIPWVAPLFSINL